MTDVREIARQELNRVHAGILRLTVLRDALAATLAGDAPQSSPAPMQDPAPSEAPVKAPPASPAETRLPASEAPLPVSESTPVKTSDLGGLNERQRAIAIGIRQGRSKADLAAELHTTPGAIYQVIYLLRHRGIALPTSGKGRTPIPKAYIEAPPPPLPPLPPMRRDPPPPVTDITDITNWLKAEGFKIAAGRPGQWLIAGESYTLMQVVIFANNARRRKGLVPFIVASDAGTFHGRSASSSSLAGAS